MPGRQGRTGERRRAALLTRLYQMLRRAEASTAKKVLWGSDWTWKGASAGLPRGQSSLFGQPLRKYMVRAEPPTPRRPRPRPSHSAARGRTPASHTATGGVGGGGSGSSGHLSAGRAGPGQADAMLSYEGTSELTGPSVGEGGGGRVRTKRGREERGGPPRPLPVRGPHGRHRSAPRGKAAARARARTGDVSLLPRYAPEAPP